MAFRPGHGPEQARILWQQVGMVPIAIVSPQLANAQRTCRKHGEGTWQLCTMLANGSSKYLCLACW